MIEQYHQLYSPNMIQNSCTLTMALSTLNPPIGSTIVVSSARKLNKSLFGSMFSLIGCYIQILATPLWLLAFPPNTSFLHPNTLMVESFLSYAVGEHDKTE